MAKQMQTTALGVVRAIRDEIDASTHPKSDAALARSVGNAITRVTTMHHQHTLEPYSDMQVMLCVGTIVRAYNRAMSDNSRL